MSASPATVFDRLTAHLTGQAVPFQVARHAPVYTSDEAARVRGTALASGAKALVCKADGQYVLFVMPADRRLDSKRVRAGCGVRSLRFATAEEVLELTGLRPGAIPPFGSLFGLRTICDTHLAEQPEINFNAGDHAISISLRYEDYVAAEAPQLAELTGDSAVS